MNIVVRCLDRLGLKEPLEDWSDETIEQVVRAFIDEKFPTVLALNKIDYPDSDKVCILDTISDGISADENTLNQNISKIAKMQDPKSIVLCSAISEVFLRRLAKQNYIKYVEGSEFLDTKQDLIDMGEADGGGLKEMDEKLSKYVRLPLLWKFGLLTFNQPC